MFNACDSTLDTTESTDVTIGFPAEAATELHDEDEVITGIPDEAAVTTGIPDEVPNGYPD